MPTASVSFLAFSAVIAIAWALSSHRKWRDAVLLAANLAYLGTLSAAPAAFIPFAGLLAAGYAAVKLAIRWRGPAPLGLLLGALILAFGWLKKYWFLSFLGFLPAPYVTVGLSYVFFRVLHLVIEARHSPPIAAIGPLAYLNYTLNFTALVAGPIQRYDDFARTLPPLDLCVAGRAVERILIGLFKVLAAAPLLLNLHTTATADLLAAGAGIAWLKAGLVSIAAYPVYLYFNFSGYVDIVIGVARFIGLELPENFNRPFSAVSFIDFWGRYHITLSNWLRDYVYTPFLKVLMIRFPDPKLDPFLGTLAFFLTFFLIGIWHGPTAMFAIYGLLLALGISANKLTQTFLIRTAGRKRCRALAAHPVYQACCRGLTFTWYAASMVCFWASGDDARHILRALGGPGVLEGLALLWLAATLLLAAGEAARQAVLSVRWRGQPIAVSRYTRTAWAVVLTFLCVSAVVLTTGPAPDIVYKTF